MRTEIWKFAAVPALALLLAAAGTAHGEPARLDPAKVKLPEMTPELNRGKLSYDAFCAECHGVNAAGTDKGPTFIHRVYHPGHHADMSFVLAPKRGTRAHHFRFGDMPPVDGVNDKQVVDITKYVRAIQKANGLF